MSNVNAVCCERTLDGGICLDVSDSIHCNNLFRWEDTACESTTYCKDGTCVNVADGTCMPSSDSACDSSRGGFWYNQPEEEVTECQYGCCFLPGGPSFTSRVSCIDISSDSGISVDFRESITDEETCLLSAGPDVEGACIFQSESGRDCTIETNERCGELGREFHAGLLCSAPELGTLCTMTENTKCVDGFFEVYFEDNCGNTANVYDFSKITDVNYWTYIIDPFSVDICESGQHNKDSSTCGNCNYGLGSVCGSKRNSSANPEVGNYICIDLDCGDIGGKYREHGESWCSEPISIFEYALPGQISYRLYCYFGEVQWELCDNTRNNLCKEDETKTASEFKSEANCVPNRWQDCVIQNDSELCLDTADRDCEVLEGISLKNDTGGDRLFLNYTYTYDETTLEILGDDTDEIKAVCVPKYTPGFKFWESDETDNFLGDSFTTPTMTCGIASVSKIGGYENTLLTSDLGGEHESWIAYEGICFENCVTECEEKFFIVECTHECIKDCDYSEAFVDMEKTAWKETTSLSVGNVTLNSTWVIKIKNLSSAFGDCGVKANYIGEGGYNAWEDIFTGDNISIWDIAGAEAHS